MFSAIKTQSSQKSSISGLRVTKPLLSTTLVAIMAGPPTPLGVVFIQDSAIENIEVKHEGSSDRTPPVNRLPYDLLSDIFLFLHGTSCLKGSTSSVCRLWRLVINQTPLIWSKLVIFPRRDLGVNGAVERLNALIDRSGMVLLDVDWGCLTRPKAALGFALTTCFLEKVPVNRWRSLRLGTTGAIPIHKISGTFENLREVILDNSEEAEEFLAVVAASAPKLAFLKFPAAGVTESKEGKSLKQLIGPDTLLHTAVVYQGLHSTYAIRRLHLPYALDLCPLPLLRELTLNNLTSFESKLVSLCPNLETLTVRQCLENCGTVKIIVPHLRNLIFHGPNYSVLGRVDAPKLQMLHIGRHGVNRAEQLRFLQDALDNPSYQLSSTSLQIESMCDIMTIIQLIQLSPGLTNLTVTTYSDTEGWKSMFLALGRRRRAHSEGMELLGWQLCEHLVTLHISFSWTQLDVEEARGLAKDLLVERPIIQRVSFEWIDGYSIVIHG